MNLEKLFKAQKELDSHIEKEKGLEGQDLLDKKILALQVELGELANNWRGFKFWSEDREPRTFNRKHCPDCMEKGYRRGNPPYDEKLGTHGLGNHWYFCEKCAGFLVVDENPLLEEYVDGLHFLLSIGLDLELQHVEPTKIGHFKNVTESFLQMFRELSMLMVDIKGGVETAIITSYTDLFGLFIGLGKQLGFSWQEIEQAYFEKNKINHERQANGY